MVGDRNKVIFRLQDRSWGRKCKEMSGRAEDRSKSDCWLMRAGNRSQQQSTSTGGLSSQVFFMSTQKMLFPYIITAKYPQIFLKEKKNAILKESTSKPAASALSGPFNSRFSLHCGKKTQIHLSHLSLHGRDDSSGTPRAGWSSWKLQEKALTFKRRQWFWTSQGFWHILLEDGLWHQHYKAKPEGHCTHIPPQLLKTSLLFSLGKCITFHHLYKLPCRRLIWGSTGNFYLLFDFQHHLRAGDSTTGISVSYNLILVRSVCMSQYPLCAQTHLCQESHYLC